MRQGQGRLHPVWSVVVVPLSGGCRHCGSPELGKIAWGIAFGYHSQQLRWPWIWSLLVVHDRRLPRRRPLIVLRPRHQVYGWTVAERPSSHSWLRCSVSFPMLLSPPDVRMDVSSRFRHLSPIYPTKCTRSKEALFSQIHCSSSSKCEIENHVIIM